MNSLGNCCMECPILGRETLVEGVQDILGKLNNKTEFILKFSNCQEIDFNFMCL
jgi:hypothetical protein